MKFLFILFLVVIGILYAGNYLDYRRGAISRIDFERRIRLSIILLLFIIFLYFALR